MVGKIHRYTANFPQDIIGIYPMGLLSVSISNAWWDGHYWFIFSLNNFPFIFPLWNCLKPIDFLNKTYVIWITVWISNVHPAKQLFNLLHHMKLCEVQSQNDTENVCHSSSAFQIRQLTTKGNGWSFRSNLWQLKGTVMFHSGIPDSLKRGNCRFLSLIMHYCFK